MPDEGVYITALHLEKLSVTKHPEQQKLGLIPTRRSQATR